MAIAEKVDSRLQLIFIAGFDEITGDIITKTKSFNNIKTEATTEELLRVTEALVSLQQYDLQAVRRNDTSLLSQN